MQIREQKTVTLFRLVALLGWMPVGYGQYEYSQEFLAANPLLTPIFATYLSLVVGSALLSFVFEHVKRYLALYCFIGCLFLTYYHGLILQATNMDLHDVSSTLITTGLLCFLFHKVSLVVAWSVLASAITISTALVIPSPPYPITELVLELFAIVLISSGISISLIRIKEALVRSSGLIKAIFAQSADALIYGSMNNSKFSQANKTALDLFMTDNVSDIDPLIRKALAQKYDSKQTKKILRKAFSTAGWRDTMEFCTATGSRFYGSLAINELSELDERIFVLRISDITELRDKQLALEAAKDEAEVAAEARSRFLANMSHEIRTPMNGVIGMTSLLMNTKLNDEQMSYLQTIRGSGESLLTIINEILDFSKIDASQVELENQVFDLEHCVADALDIVTPNATQKGLEVILDLRADDTLLVEGDVQRLRQILVNLLSNAVKFTQTGEVSLRVRVDKGPSSEPGKNCRLHFQVQDTGIGIPAANQASLFDAFTQADASTTRRFGGTGLGLSISRSLVELMGGDLTLTSTEGLGSTFSFSIVAKLAENEQRENLPSLQDHVAFAVDDNATNREVLSNLLHWLGMDVHMFATPHELLAALSNSRATNKSPDLVITDMAMPHMDGIQLAAEIQKNMAQPPPMMLLTSLDQPASGRTAFDCVLRKPVRPSDLFYGISGMLRSAPQLPTKQKSNNLPRLDMANQTVLVAEDNLVNQVVARQILKKLNVQSDTVGNGQEAIDVLKKRAYSIIFMDVQMPELDGIEATRRIRANRQITQPYIIAMTANAMEEDKERCLAAGMDDFVAKPIRIEDIYRKLQQVCEQEVADQTDNPTITEPA